jgi:GNAT superfamily N-acetyltransferase
MASCSAFLNDSDEFNEVDPSADWDKWANRVPGAFSLFYAAIVDPLQPEGGRGIHCVLRAVLDSWPTPTPPHKPRLIVDYVATRRTHRGRGHATRLLEHVRSACAALAANCYVLALEESCPYWMDRGFVLEEVPR